MTFEEQKQNQYEMNQKIKDTLSNYLYYFIIGITTLIVMFLFPFIGSTVGMEWNLPNTTVGWVVYVISCLATSTSNVLIFSSFINQGRLNSSLHPNYIQATDLLLKCDRKEKRPRSPKRFLSFEYTKKGGTIAIMSILGLVGLSQMILRFDLVQFISTTITIVFTIIFGLVEMKKVELYWCYEYLEYAREFVKEQKEEEKC